MKAFFDTSVLVAAFYEDHPHHNQSFSLFIKQKKSTGAAAAHTLAEVYSTLTNMPGKNRATPDEAMLFVKDISARLGLISLTVPEYLSALEESTVLGITGGGVYDALIGHCFRKSRASTLYTWNVKHFVRLSPAIAEYVKTP